MRRIILTMSLLCSGAIYAGPRFDVHHGNGGAVVVLFIILGLIWLFKKK